MSPEALAALHRAAFVQDRAWTAAEFADLLKSAFVRLLTRPGGFALIRTLAGESELLTLAVAPAAQRRGTGRALMGDWAASIAGHADTAFLEVASDNDAARALYLQSGFEQVATRPAYYRRRIGPDADALIMRRAVTPGQAAV